MTQGHIGDVAKNVDSATGYISNGCWELQAIIKSCTGTLKGLILLPYIWVWLTLPSLTLQNQLKLQSFQTHFLFTVGGTINIGKGFRMHLEFVTTGRFRYLTVWTCSDAGKYPICLVKYMDKIEIFLKSLKMLMKTDKNSNSHK